MGSLSMSLRRDASRGVVGTRSLSFFEGSFKANFAMLAKLADQTRSISGAERFLAGERFPGEPHDFHFLRTEAKAGTSGFGHGGGGTHFDAWEIDGSKTTTTLSLS
jgi:hypothetical protein